jgi:cytochrome oxidase Cu insertion factor (SCO1/SenC/PrrC family)
MKSFLLAIISTFSLNTFSQSFLIMDNGITITTDTSGYAYDFGHYAFPQKVILKGGQYFVEEGGILATIDENGLLFRKYELIPEKILGKGINYFLSDEGFLYTIDNKGYVHVTESELYKDAIKFGGNYFAVAVNKEKTEVDFYIITSEGKAVKTGLPILKTKDIISYGGRYFMNNRGVVFAMASDGKVVARDEMRVGILTKKGGNYFTDSSGYFYTVSEAGELLMPALPASLKVGTIKRLGSNYFIDQSGKFYLVDKNGEVFERTMRDHDFRLAKIISL